ncbi:MAG: c-type cytochrome [Steroidobacteraceae bacterium]
MEPRNLVLTVTFALVLAGCGKKEASAPAATATAPAATTASAPSQAAAPTTSGVDVGEDVFGKACRACHEMGIAGAPKLGDAADWAPRIAQGMDVLYQHSLEGFTGKKGVMPAKGGFTTLSDAEVTAAVDYMVLRAR